MTHLAAGTKCKVEIPGRGKGTVEIVKHFPDERVDAKVLTGTFRNRLKDSDVVKDARNLKDRGPDSFLCFSLDDPGIVCVPLKKGDG